MDRCVDLEEVFWKRTTADGRCRWLFVFLHSSSLWFTEKCEPNCTGKGEVATEVGTAANDCKALAFVKTFRDGTKARDDEEDVPVAQNFGILSWVGFSEGASSFLFTFSICWVCSAGKEKKEILSVKVNLVKAVKFVFS